MFADILYRICIFTPVYLPRATYQALGRVKQISISAHICYCVDVVISAQCYCICIFTAVYLARPLYSIRIFTPVYLPRTSRYRKGKL